MSKFRTQEELSEYLKGGGVVKLDNLLSSVTGYAKVNEHGRLVFLNGHNTSQYLLTIDYWLKADEDVDLILIDSFNRVNSHISKID